jgi:hypothetical protein
VKIAVSFVGKQMGLKVVFDDSVKDDSLSIELTDVTPEQGLKLIFDEKKLQARIMEEKTIIVYRDDEANHKKYEQYDLWPANSKPQASRLSGASTKSFVKFAAVQETADDDQTTNIDRDRKSRD